MVEKEESHNQNLGKRGEGAAVKFLKKQGYSILEKRWVCKAGEADIIALDENSLVFIEVKTRSNCENGLPEEAVDARKRKRYERIAISYLQETNHVDVEVRFDVITILVVASDRAFLRHHINAFGVGE